MEQKPFGEYLANLYGDQADPTFSAMEPWIPTVEQLEEAHIEALCNGHIDAAAALAAEIRRARGMEGADTTPGLLIGSKAGLWRLH